MPYIIDDDLGTYYCQYYIFVHSTRSDDGTLNLVADQYSLSDNSLYRTQTIAWDTSKMSVGFDFTVMADFRLHCFSSYFDYLSDAASIDYITFSGKFYSGSVTDLSSSDGISFVRGQTSTFTPDTDIKDDYGFIISSEPFDLWLNQTDLDTSKIPDDYVITPVGDNIYNYTITNKTGDTTTINNYVTNNYDIPSSDKPDDGGSTGGGVSGEVTVGGKIDVSGNVDININVSQGSNGNAGDYIDPGTVDADLDDYLSHVPDVSKDFIDYLKDFFSWLPKEIYGLLVLGLVVAIFCRLNGR